MSEDYAGTPLPELEALLRKGDLSPARRNAVEAELNRRYAEKWRGATPAAQPPPWPGPAATTEPGPAPNPAWPGRTPAEPPRPGPAPQPAAWAPAAPVAPASTNSTTKVLLGCAAAFVVAIVAVVVVAVLVDSGSSPPPTGTVCVTQFGNCPMVDSLPVGASCFCRTPNGDVAGVVD